MPDEERRGGLCEVCLLRVHADLSLCSSGLGIAKLCPLWFGRVVAKFLCVLASLEQGRCMVQRNEATVDDSEDEVAEGPPTPVEVALPPTVRQLREMLDTLWDDGEETTIYMMEGYLRTQRELGPGQVEWHVWQELLRFGHSDQRGYLTPWWRMWLGRVAGVRHSGLEGSCRSLGASPG